MNKKGFTLIELLSVIVLLAIILVFAVFSYTRYLKLSKDKILKVDINTIEDAALTALTDCEKNPTGEFCTKYPIPDGGSSITILYSDLINNDYVENFKNPYNKDEYCDANSYVVVTRKVTNTLTGSVDDSDLSFTYNTCLRCGGVNSQARFKMGKIMKDNGLDTTEISSCTQLTTSQIDSIK